VNLKLSLFLAINGVSVGGNKPELFMRVVRDAFLN
jgi:hypothetical protein